MSLNRQDKIIHGHSDTGCFYKKMFYVSNIILLINTQMIYNIIEYNFEPNDNYLTTITLKNEISMILRFVNVNCKQNAINYNPGQHQFTEEI